MGRLNLKAMVNIIPASLISRSFGHLSELKLPKPAQRLVNKGFAKLAGLNMREAEQKLSQYQSLQELFTRRLKEGARKIGQGLVSPVDGTLSAFGKVEAGVVLEAKGRGFSAEELIGSSSENAWLQDSFFFIIYLSPRNYHRIHAPRSGQVTGMTYVPGRLLPVNRLGKWLAPDLFPTNERLCSLMIDEDGRKLALVKVGATCVGKIEVLYDDFSTNADGFREPFQKTLEKAYEVEAGDELGVFKLGSTVVLFVENEHFEPSFGLRTGQRLRLGQSLGQWKA